MVTIGALTLKSHDLNLPTDKSAGNQDIQPVHDMIIWIINGKVHFFN